MRKCDRAQKPKELDEQINYKSQPLILRNITTWKGNVRQLNT